MSFAETKQSETLKKVGANISTFREENGMSKTALANAVGKSRDTISAYENGAADIPLTVLEDIGGALGVTTREIIFGRDKPKEPDAMKVKIYNQDERMSVAAILVKNGYTVAQGKEQRTKTGKTVDYFLRVTEDADNAESAR